MLYGGGVPAAGLRAQAVSQGQDVCGRGQGLYGDLTLTSPTIFEANSMFKRTLELRPAGNIFVQQIKVVVFSFLKL